MDVSVIVASGRKHTDDCLKSLIAQQGDFRHEVILAYDASNMPANQLSEVRYIKCETTNPAAKRNIAAKISSGKVLAFIDDDAIAPPGWIERGMEVLKTRPYAAGCGGPNLPPARQTPQEQLSDAILATGIGSGSGSYRSGGEAREARVGEIHLVNFFVRRGVFENMGGFNEALGYGAEDSEFIYLCGRLAKAPFIYDPELRVEHRRRPFGREFLSQRYRLRKQNGRILWVRPGMYITRKAGLSLVLLAVFLWLSFVIPIALAAMIAVYAALLIYSSRSVKNVGKIRWIVSVMLLHLVSAAGIFLGWLIPPSKDKYRRLLRRPA